MRSFDPLKVLIGTQYIAFATMAIFGTAVAIWLVSGCLKTYGRSGLRRLAPQLLFGFVVAWVAITIAFSFFLYGGFAMNKDYSAWHPRWFRRVVATLNFTLPFLAGYGLLHFAWLWATARFRKLFPELAEHLIHPPVPARQEGLRPQLSMSALLSALLFILPVIGLPMALHALKDIKRSEGRRYGRKLALVSCLLNGITLSALVIMVLALGVFGKRAAGD